MWAAMIIYKSRGKGKKKKINYTTNFYGLIGLYVVSFAYTHTISLYYKNKDYYNE